MQELLCQMVAKHCDLAVTKHLICNSIPSDDFATGMLPVSATTEK